jgi:hypothetical protein
MVLDSNDVSSVLPLGHDAKGFVQNLQIKWF